MPSPHEIQILPFFPPSGAVTRASGASHFAISVPSVTARKTSSGEASSSTESSMSRVFFLFMAVGSFLIGVWRLWVGERNDAMHASARSGLVVGPGGEPRDLARKLPGSGGTIGRRRRNDFCLAREHLEDARPEGSKQHGGVSHGRNLHRHTLLVKENYFVGSASLRASSAPDGRSHACWVNRARCRGS